MSKFYSLLPNTLSHQDTADMQEYADPVVDTCIDDHEQEETWCYCKQVQSGEMVGCDNKDCFIEWFHFPCVGISRAPKGKWYCPDCRKLPQFKRGLKKKVIEE